MNLATIGAFALVLTSLGYFLGCRRAYSSVAGNLQKLHSLPPYHGLHAALWVALPSVALLLVWPLLSSYLISNMVTSSLPLEIRTQDPHKVELILNDIRQINNGNAVIQDNNTTIKDAAEYQSMLEQMSNLWLKAVIIIISASTYLWHRKHFYPQLRARHTVEKTVRILLIGCSTISIFVTIGIFTLTQQGLEGSIFQMISHGIISAALFEEIVKGGSLWSLDIFVFTFPNLIIKVFLLSIFFIEFSRVFLLNP